MCGVHACVCTRVIVCSCVCLCSHSYSHTCVCLRLPAAFFFFFFFKDHPTAKSVSPLDSSVLATPHQMSAMIQYSQHVQEELGQILTEGMGRERGEEIDIYFIIYFKCLHFFVLFQA